MWTATTVAHTVPFIGGAVALTLLAPILAPVSLVLLIHAWAIPELYAARGAKVLRPRRGDVGASPSAWRSAFSGTSRPSRRAS